MFTRVTSAAIAALCVLLPTVGLADGLLYQLPKDGAWVRFDIDSKGTENDGSEVALVGALTMSSVGTTEVDGVQCRWIEIAVEGRRNGEPLAGIYKLLIPEQYLAKGKAPLKHVLNLWQKHLNVADGRPTQIEDLRGRGARYLRPLRQFLHGPFETAKKLDKVSIDGKLGKLACEGVVASERSEKGGVTLDSTYRIRLHSKAPFGVVTWQAELKLARDGQVFGTMTMTMKLIDFGTNAESAIPDTK